MRDPANRCPSRAKHAKSGYRRKRRCTDCGAFHVPVANPKPSRTEGLIRRKLREIEERAQARAAAKAALEQWQAEHDEREAAKT